MLERDIYEQDHRELGAAVKSFVDRSLLPRHGEFCDEHALPRDVWLEAGALGILGLAVPSSYGGGDATDYRFNAVVTEELSRASAAIASAITIHMDVVAPYLVELTDSEQKARWLPGFCTGDLIAAIAMTEASGGSDLAALKTRAVRDGRDWVLNGSKTFITNGSIADLVVVAARTVPEGGRNGISLFVVERDMPGFSQGTVLEKIGQLDADTAELYFQDVRLPASSLIGELNRGFAHMMERLPQERISAAVANISHSRWILEETLEYAKQRTAFGQSIGSYQHNSFLLAELFTKADVTQAFVDKCVIAHAGGRLSASDAAKAKWWTADIQGQILDACLQLYGGYGFMREYRVARAWSDARVTRIWAGTNEIMKLIISRDLGL